MASSFGVTFTPSGQDENGLQGRQTANRTPVQEAVKILSLRLPKFYSGGSQGIAPAPLLTAAGGMGQPGARGNVTAQALAQLAGVPSMAPPQAAPQAPVLGGGGTDSYSGWRDQERSINQPLAPGGGGVASPSPAPALGPIPTPRFTPGQTTDGGSPTNPGTGSWIDPRPDLPMPTPYVDTPPMAQGLPYLRDKYKALFDEY